MTDQHRATPEQWAKCEEDARLWSGAFNCILELRARVEALEQQNKDLCIAVNNAVVWNTEQNQRIEALEAAQQDKLDRLIALDAADPTPDSAMTELRAASAEAQPAGGLVEMLGDVWSEGQPLNRYARVAAIRTVATWLDRFALHGSGEYAQAAKVLRQEVGQ
jgi:hypothetical protein